MERIQDTRLALIIPGMRFGPHVPLLAYAYRAAEIRGAHIVPLSWPPLSGKSAADLGPWVAEQVSSAIDRLAELKPVSKPLLIGKSLGSHAAAVAAERALPAIWLTPLLQYPTVCRALQRASAPFLLVGGTADPAWDGQAARSLSDHTLEVPGADHAMHVPGPVAASAAVLGQVADAVEHFIDQAVWAT